MQAVADRERGKNERGVSSQEGREAEISRTADREKTPEEAEEEGETKATEEKNEIHPKNRQREQVT